MALRPDFVTSDTHYQHINIIDFCDRPYDHEAIMIKRWRSTVRDSHTILHLGDLFFSRKGGYKRFAETIAPQLTGKKYLILGNHDRRDIDYEALGFEVIQPYMINYRGFTVSFDHYPRLLHDNERRIHLHGHVHRLYANGEAHRPNNVNVSVEVTDYRPQRFSHLVNTAIALRKQGGRYYNSKSYRQSHTANSYRYAP